MLRKREQYEAAKAAMAVLGPVGVQEVRDRTDGGEPFESAHVMLPGLSPEQARELAPRWLAVALECGADLQVQLFTAGVCLDIHVRRSLLDGDAQLEEHERRLEAELARVRELRAGRAA